MVKFYMKKIPLIFTLMIGTFLLAACLGLHGELSENLQREAMLQSEANRLAKEWEEVNQELERVIQERVEIEKAIKREKCEIAFPDDRLARRDCINKR